MVTGMDRTGEGKGMEKAVDLVIHQVAMDRVVPMGVVVVTRVDPAGEGKRME